MAEAKEKLFSEFPPVSTQEWMDKITADLKGAPFEKKLVWKTGEGFNVHHIQRHIFCRHAFAQFAVNGHTHRSGFCLPTQIR